MIHPVDIILKLMTVADPYFKRLIPDNNENVINHSVLYSFSATVKETPAVGIKFVVSGREKYHLSNRLYELRDNEYLLINRGRNVDFEVHEAVPVIGVCMNLDSTSLATAYQLHTGCPSRMLDNPSDELLLPDIFYEGVYHSDDSFHQFFYTNVKSFIKEKRELSIGGDEFFAESAIRLVRAQLLIRDKIKNLDAVRKTTQLEIVNRISKAKEIIHDDMEKNMSLKEIAAVVSMSEYHFLRSFTKLTGNTPHQYRTRIRMQKARELLGAGYKGITDVAYCVGYPDVSSFSKAFKKYFGHSPNKAD